MDGGTVAIKGRDADEAVLTTCSQSYAIRLADSSNTMLLIRGAVEVHGPEAAPSTDAASRTVTAVRTVSRTDVTAAEEDGEAAGAPEMTSPIQIQARVQEHFELVRCAPRLGRTRALLASCPYAGEAADAALDAAPRAELEEALTPNRPSGRPTLEQLEREAQYVPPRSWMAALVTRIWRVACFRGLLDRALGSAHRAHTTTSALRYPVPDDLLSAYS